MRGAILQESPLTRRCAPPSPRSRGARDLMGPNSLAGDPRGEKRLRRPALAAEVVQRVAARPRVRRVTDGAERLLRDERALAVVAGDGKAGGVRVVLAAHF